MKWCRGLGSQPGEVVVCLCVEVASFVVGTLPRRMTPGLCFKAPSWLGACEVLVKLDNFYEQGKKIINSKIIAQLQRFLKEQRRIPQSTSELVNKEAKYNGPVYNLLPRSINI